MSRSPDAILIFSPLPSVTADPSAAYAWNTPPTRHSRRNRQVRDDAAKAARRRRRFDGSPRWWRLPLFASPMPSVSVPMAKP